MSKTKLLSALAASVSVLVAACWLVTNTFPLAAAPQVVSDSPGISVDVGAATLLHRAPVQYPEAARAKRIQGAIVLELTFDGSGNVSDARVLSGPEELRKAALQSALQWHFAREASGNKRQVTIAFQMPANEPPPPPREPARTTVEIDGARQAAGNPAVSARMAEMQKQLQADRDRKRTLKSVNVEGLPDQARDELLARLNLRVGSLLSPNEATAILRGVREFDEHLGTNVTFNGPDELVIQIVAPASAPRAAFDSNALRVGGNEQATKLVRQPRPAYPVEAKAARIQGVVKLFAVIAKDGTISRLEVMSGHPLLVPSALEAVKNWAYQPTLLNGVPVEVQTQIDVNYTLSQ